MKKIINKIILMLFTILITMTVITGCFAKDDHTKDKKEEPKDKKEKKHDHEHKEGDGHVH